jgi:hypothetical protein
MPRWSISLPDANVREAVVEGEYLSAEALAASVRVR